MQKAILKRTSRFNAGHLWIFSNELAGSPKAFEPGELVEIMDSRSNFLGIGYANPHSLIAVRLLSRERTRVDEDFFRDRINKALEYRRRLLGPERESFRVVFSESDWLPGLIVDKYADCLSVQVLTYGMERLTDIILKVLDEIFAPRLIVLRNDSSMRSLEGLGQEKRVVKGEPVENPVITEGPVRFEVDPMAGQKTGFFMDQAENRMALAGVVKGGSALDLFCYTGAWSVALANAGAHVRGIDVSERAITQAQRNAEINGLGGKCEFVTADVFEEVKRELAAENLYDTVVLDPPAFVKSKARIKEALRAYRELNAASMKLTRPGGLLATSSCSYHIDRQMFMEVLRAAAKDAGRHARVVEARGQAKDHPVSLAVPETEYLKCVILELT